MAFCCQRRACKTRRAYGFAYSINDRRRPASEQFVFFVAHSHHHHVFVGRYPRARVVASRLGRGSRARSMSSVSGGALVAGSVRRLPPVARAPGRSSAASTAGSRRAPSSPAPRGAPRRRLSPRARAVGPAPSAGPTRWCLDECPPGLISDLALALEARWRALPGARDAPCDRDLRSVDAAADASDPSTRIRIENLCVATETFRKLHLEVAWGLGGIEVLHCVAYPWADVPAPIFAADLVAFGGRVTLCIADACPLAEDLSLPEPYVDAAERLKREMMARCPALEPRPLPEWGETILSRDACVCAGPPVDDFPEQAQARAFARYAEGLHDAYLDAVRDAATCAFETSEGEYGGSARERLAAQVRFCEKQLLNDKTRKVLERAMGAESTERYMTRVLFDVTEETPTFPP